MAIAGATVLLITAAARYLGAEVAGFLAPLPVLAAIMATASHRDSGSDAVHGLLRGTVFGLWGGAAFFSVVILLVGTVGPLVTYVAAFVSAVLAGSIAVMVQAAVRRSVRRRRGTCMRRPGDGLWFTRGSGNRTTVPLRAFDCLVRCVVQT